MPSGCLTTPTAGVRLHYSPSTLSVIIQKDGVSAISRPVSRWQFFHRASELRPVFRIRRKQYRSAVWHLLHPHAYLVRRWTKPTPSLCPRQPGIITSLVCCWRQTPPSSNFSCGVRRS